MFPLCLEGNPKPCLSPTRPKGFGWWPLLTSSHCCPNETHYLPLMLSVSFSIWGPLFFLLSLGLGFWSNIVSVLFPKATFKVNPGHGLWVELNDIAFLSHLQGPGFYPEQHNVFWNRLLSSLICYTLIWSTTMYAMWNNDFVQLPISLGQSLVYNDCPEVYSSKGWADSYSREFSFHSEQPGK